MTIDPRIVPILVQLLFSVVLFAAGSRLWQEIAWVVLVLNIVPSGPH